MRGEIGLIIVVDITTTIMIIIIVSVGYYGAPQPKVKALQYEARGILTKSKRSKKLCIKFW